MNRDYHIAMKYAAQIARGAGGLKMRTILFLYINYSSARTGLTTSVSIPLGVNITLGFARNAKSRPASGCKLCKETQYQLKMVM